MTVVRMGKRQTGQILPGASCSHNAEEHMVRDDMVLFALAGQEDYSLILNTHFVCYLSFATEARVTAGGAVKTKLHRAHPQQLFIK